MRKRLIRWISALAVVAIPTMVSAHDGNSDPSMVHACVGSVSKAVRIVEVSGSCVSAPADLAETPLHWARQGPQGVPGVPGAPGTSTKSRGYFSGNQLGCPNGGAIYSNGDPPVFSYVCNGVNGKDAALTAFEMLAGLPCTLPNGTSSAIKIAISQTGAVSLNCGDPPRYVDNRDGTVTDVANGLTWLQRANCMGVLDYNAAVVAVGTLADGMCGLNDRSKPGDWRLPNVDEFVKVYTTAYALGCRRPTLTNDAGTGCFADGAGSSFVGVGGGGSNNLANVVYLLDKQNPTPFIPLIDLAFGSIDPFPYSVPGRVWPVRSVAR